MLSVSVPGPAEMREEILAGVPGCEGNAVGYWVIREEAEDDVERFRMESSLCLMLMSPNSNMGPQFRSQSHSMTLGLVNFS
jgi:hypothetical protein